MLAVYESKRNSILELSSKNVDSMTVIALNSVRVKLKISYLISDLINNGPF